MASTTPERTTLVLNLRRGHAITLVVDGMEADVMLGERAAVASVPILIRAPRDVRVTRKPPARSTTDGE